MWVHLWLQGMMIVHMNNPPVPLSTVDCENRRAGLEQGLVEESRRSGGLIYMAGSPHPVHHFLLTCEKGQLPLGTIRSQG